ncbi:hypothetical protein THII_3919 [Thioploca ingrica]|uniref:DUF5615 domain-containing protein n=1 Tax=Thioploca ingrica TaxID=40754 RepID=A0A090BW95_9GAMM|nr:hypothetical protein THII_3919 [Thioploca ingrica]
MKLLLDTCIWGGTVKTLNEYGYDVIWSGDWQVDPGDNEILAYAYQQQRILITLDKDFGELAIVYAKPHYGIVRLVGLTAKQQSTYCLKVLRKYADELESGAIITVTQERVRIRSAK